MDIDSIIEQVGAEEKEALAEGVTTPVEQEEPTAPASEARDLYAEKKAKDTEFLGKNYAHGSSQIVAFAIDQVLNKPRDNGQFPMKGECTVVKNEIKQLVKNKRQDRAEARRRQYMEDVFLPAVEIVVRATSPDELLNSEYGLRKLDDCAIIDIAGHSGRGYTGEYIRNTYAAHLGGKGTTVSDPLVRDKMRRINDMMDRGQIRDALALAKQIKASIDKGGNIANDADYELLGRIVSYYGTKA